MIHFSFSWLGGVYARHLAAPRGRVAALWRFGVAAALVVIGGLSSAAGNWPAWHGPHGSGVSPERDLPLKWSAEENVAWKVELPQRGNSSPIVWKDRIFVTQALEKEKALRLICFDRQQGRRLWEHGTTYEKPDETHETNPYASPSPVTDGQHVIAWFGSAGLYCYDYAGKELWRRDLGRQQHEWGYASSPVLHGDLCFLYFGPGERTFLLAVDKRSGKTVWEVNLPPVDPKNRTDGFAGRQGGIVGSWSTPLVISAKGRQELVLTVPEQVKSFDLKTGEELWRCDGLNPLIYTSPIYGDGVVVGMGGFLGSALAVRPGEGDITSTGRLWHKTRTKNRIGSGVIYNGHIYILNTEGIAECTKLETGDVVWEERLRGPGPKSESWSSMTLAGDRIYVPNQSGDVLVIKASPKFEVLAANSIGNELCNASLAISQGQLFLRTHKHLWCIGEGRHEASQ